MEHQPNKAHSVDAPIASLFAFLRRWRRATCHFARHDKDEMQKILSEHLAKFRVWGYAQLAERVERDRQTSDCLDHIEGTATDGTQFQIEFNAFWDDKPHGDVRVSGSFWAEPQRPLLGFIPIYTADVTDSFIMSPDGRFIGEDEKTVA